MNYKYVTLTVPYRLSEIDNKVSQLFHEDLLEKGFERMGDFIPNFWKTKAKMFYRKLI